MCSSIRPAPKIATCGGATTKPRSLPGSGASSWAPLGSGLQPARDGAGEDLGDGQHPRVAVAPLHDADPDVAHAVRHQVLVMPRALHQVLLGLLHAREDERLAGVVAVGAHTL